MKTVAIIQARMTSSRLPGKVLADLDGRPVLAWVVRAAMAVPGVDKVVVATSVNETDEPIADWCVAEQVACYRGSEIDVLARYHQAAIAENADIILRLTADCPFIDPQVCGQVIALLKRTGADYACNTDPASWPDGLDCWAVTRQSLDTAAREATRPSEREHVLSYIRHNRKRFDCVGLKCPVPGLQGERWTVDTPDDLRFVSEVAERLLSSEMPPSHLDILMVLEKGPELREINAINKRNEGYDQSLAGEGMRDTTCFDETERALSRALETVPLGAQTFSRSHIQFPRGYAPLFLTHGDAGRVWDVDGNEFIDLVCGLMPVVLGYRDPEIDDAIRRQLDRGITFSLATELEAEVAEKLVETVPCAEMVRFGKNGSDATTGAVRVARAATGREIVAVCGYHGWHDWYVGSTTRNKGIPKAVQGLTCRFEYNNLASLQRLFSDHPGQIAAVIMEPMNMIEPAPGFLQDVVDLTRREGAILVFDEIITGFRFARGGAQEYFGVTPDIAAFGKALGNGMPIAAVVGRRDIMMQMEEIFFSSTFGGEALSLAAASALLDKFATEPVIETLWQRGEALNAGIRQRIADYGLQETVKIRGMAPWTVLDVSDHPKARKEAVKTHLLSSLNTKGVLTVGVHSVCYAHTQADIEGVHAAYDHALERLRSDLDAGDFEARMPCPAIEPVFKVR